jgi:hypothetical protein
MDELKEFRDADIANVEVICVGYSYFIARTLAGSGQEKSRVYEDIPVLVRRMSWY